MAGLIDVGVEALPLLVPGLLLFFVFLVVWLVVSAFRGVGFTVWEVTLLLFIAPFVEGINIPVWRSGGTLIAVNLAGAVIPMYVTGRALAGGRAPVPETILGIAFVAFIVHRYAEVVPGEGIRAPALLPALVAGLLAVPLAHGHWRRTGLLAFGAGSMGALVGADLLNLRAVIDLAPPGDGMVASIGGAGTQDGIFLVGMTAVLLDMLVVAMLRATGRNGRRAPVRPA